MIELKNIGKKYGDKTVFSDFSLSFEENKITAILGESGSGKTTLLKIVSGLTDFAGEIKGVKKTSFVFQRDRLVPHLTVKENILLVNAKADVTELLNEAGLKGAENLYPKELSAGMARRVAIIRAFCYDAPIILMDEPLVNLDLALKYSLIEKIRELKEKHGKTVLFVTHDVKEASLIADRVIIIKNGRAIFDEDTDKTRREIIEKKITETLLGNSELAE